MKMITKPRIRICHCEKCEAEFAIGKRDWKNVRTEEQTEIIYDAEHWSRETRWYSCDIIKCPICKNATLVHRRRIYK